MKKENDILEKTLDIAESGYDNAYLFLLDAYKKDPENYRTRKHCISCPVWQAGQVCLKKHWSG